MARIHMRADDFRRIALGMAGAIESAHMGHPDFRAHGRIFATLQADNRRGMVALTPEQQAQFMRETPGTFEPASGAWGRQGATMVVLASADDDVVGEAMTLAWQNSAHKAAARRAPAKPATAKRAAVKRATPKRAAAKRPAKPAPRSRER